MVTSVIDIQQFVKFIEDKGPEALLPQNLPDKWLDRLSSAAVEARKRQENPPLAVRIAVLSLREQRAVKERDVPKREKKYDALDFEEWVIRYSRDLEREQIRRQAGKNPSETKAPNPLR